LLKSNFPLINSVCESLDDSDDDDDYWFIYFFFFKCNGPFFVKNYFTCNTDFYIGIYLNFVKLKHYFLVRINPVPAIHRCLSDAEVHDLFSCLFALTFRCSWRS
jgi:hypothetical protein